MFQSIFHNQAPKFVLVHTATGSRGKEKIKKIRGASSDSKSFLKKYNAP
jgi:hypothetical protein